MELVQAVRAVARCGAKLGFRGRADIVRYAISQGWMEEGAARWPGGSGLLNLITRHSRIGNEYDGYGEAVRPSQKNVRP